MDHDTVHVHTPETAPTIARRLAPGQYRAECIEPTTSDTRPCGWTGPLRQGPWWESRRAAEQDASEHAGRSVAPVAGPTPTRPVRIPDRIWLPLVQVADEEGISASEVLRQAIEADPRVARILAAASAEPAAASAS